ncbi:MAG TPA: ribosome maturation factor RimP [Kofleriaceae bacterium]|nr:ribosome maturation factor RimP [Kofleriaceae bacterium]
MQDPRKTRQKLIEIAEPVCAGAGYELVDLRYLSEGSWVVRVYIDRSTPGAPGISFEDCEQVSRELSAVLDVEDPLPQAYRLEVSSPGIDRPLRTAPHFERFAQQRARITLIDGVDGRRNFTGTLQGIDSSPDSTVVLIDVDGTHFRLPLHDIASAKLIPDWNQLSAN